jgi:ComF family protein
MPDAKFSDAILNLLFPLACILCNALVLERQCGPLCPSCWNRMKPLQPPFCPQCGIPESPAENIAGLCSACRLQEYAFDFARSAYVFNDPLREAIHHLKYSDRVSLARPLGKALHECLDREDFQGTVVVPVPLHRRRERQRGFNQAELLARMLGRKLDNKVLRRRKNTPSQTGLSRSQRTLNLSGAFEVCGPVAETVVVVDDVFTTGSTLHEISKILKRAGAKRVEVLTVARVL